MKNSSTSEYEAEAVSGGVLDQTIIAGLCLCMKADCLMVVSLSSFSSRS